MKLTLNLKDYRWIAKDEDGRIFLYRGRPEISFFKPLWVAKDSGCCLDETVHLFSIPDLGHWRDSLHEILPDGSLRKPLPDLKVDDKILVKFTDHGPWERRHFSHYDTDRGCVRVYGDGCTSWTSNVSTVKVKDWRLPD
jgi:hypothetical protein